MAKRRKKGRARKRFNLILGSLIFALLIGTAFSFGIIFGIGFILGFLFSIYTKTLEKKPLIPIFLFLAALVLRYALNFVPSLLNSQNIVEAIIPGFFLVVLIVVWWRLRKGEWKIWK